VCSGLGAQLGEGGGAQAARAKLPGVRMEGGVAIPQHSQSQSY
jgi:hypothetical protein